MKPKVAILYTEGINRDQESSYAFSIAGAETDIVHLTELESGTKKLSDYQILFAPGGFSYGDDVMSAKIWAAKSLAHFEDQLEKFSQEDKLIIGVCNGFQYLIRTGLLPFTNVGQIEATLTHNSTNHFEGRYVKVRVEKSNCIFTQGMEGKILNVPTSHCEGRFLAPNEILDKLNQDQQIVFKYVDEAGNPTQNYPANPNGSTRAIAGICSPNGKIMGLMPHPECNTKFNHYTNWNIEGQEGGQCLEIFKNAVNYFA